MKLIRLLVSAFIALLALVGCKTQTTFAPAPTGRLVYYHYSEQGTMAQPNCDYTLVRQDSTCLLTFFNHDLCDYDSVTVSDTIFDEIHEQIMAHKMYQYIRHYEPMMQVLDGDSWGMEFKYDDGSYTLSGGYNAWPPSGGLGKVEIIIAGWKQQALETRNAAL